MIELFKPDKYKVIFSAIIYFVWSVLTFMSNAFSCMAAIICSPETTHHSVPNSFPGAKCGQICANQSELIMGYIQYYFLSYILPLIVIYISICLIIFVVKKRVSGH